MINCVQLRMNVSGKEGHTFYARSRQHLVRHRHGHYAAIAPEGESAGATASEMRVSVELVVAYLPAAASRCDDLDKNGLGRGWRRHVCLDLRVHIRQATA